MHQNLSKTICHFLRNFDEFLNGFWFYSILAGWSTWQWVFLNFSQNFWSFDTPDTPGFLSEVIWNRFEPFFLQRMGLLPCTSCLKEVKKLKCLQYWHTYSHMLALRIEPRWSHIFLCLAYLLTTYSNLLCFPWKKEWNSTTSETLVRGGPTAVLHI